MKNGINDDALSGWLIKNLEWESADKRSAELVHCHRVELGMPLDGKHAGLHATQEILP